MSYNIKLPNNRNLGDQTVESFRESFANFDDVEEISKKIVELIVYMRKLNKLLSEKERKYADLTVRYRRKYREVYLGLESKGLNSTDRKYMAEIECEEYEMNEIYLKQMIEELKRLSYSTKTELNLLQTLGSNNRAQLM